MSCLTILSFHPGRLNTMLDHVLSVNQWYLSAGILILLSYGSISGLSNRCNYPNVYGAVAGASILLLSNSILICINESMTHSGYCTSLPNNDDFNSTIGIFLLSVSVLTIISISYYNISSNIDHFEYIIVVSFLIFSALLLMKCNNVMLIYLVLELQSISLYVLISINRNNYNSIEAGIKYFILGPFSSIVLLFGISFLYGFTGLTYLADIQVFSQNILFIENYSVIYGIHFAIVLILIGLLFKVYSAPFHFWVADIYHGAPNSTVSLLALVTFIPVFYILLKLFVYTLHDMAGIWQTFVLVSSTFSMLFGSLGALYQRTVKRLIAYSSITTIGYFFTTLVSNSTLSIYGALSYFIIYNLNLLGLFTFLNNTYLYNKAHFLDRIVVLSSYSIVNKISAITISGLLFSLAGIPPFAGFFGKLYVLTSLSYDHYYVIISVMIFAAIVASFYHINIIKHMYYYDQPYVKVYTKNVSYISSIIIVNVFLLQSAYLLKPSIFNLFSTFMSFSLYM